MCNEINADIIIIGAGISGLCAALKLQEKEPTLNFLIIESNEIGGRLTQQIRINNEIIPIDICRISTLQNELIELIDKLELKLIKREFNVNHLVIFDNSGRIFTRDKHYYCTYCEEFNRPSLRNFLRRIVKLTYVERVEPQLGRLTMQEFIDKSLKSERDRAAMYHLIWRFCGVSPNEITVDFYLFVCRSCKGIEYQITLNETFYYIQGGMRAICHKIVAILNPDQIINHEHVNKIEHNSRFIKITTDKSTYFCYYAIVAVPLKCLAEIEFEPNIAKLDICRNITIGRLQQFVAIYKTPFWLEANYTGDVYITNHFPLIYCFDATINPKYPTLSGYYVEQNNDYNDIKTTILSQLRLYFGEQAYEPLDFFTFTWTESSPISCVQNVEDMVRLQERTDRIIWSGSETSLDWYGQISGGILAGYRAAIEVLYELRPACLTSQEIAFILQLHQQYNKRTNGQAGLAEIFPKPTKKCLFFLLTVGLSFAALKYGRRWL